MHPDLPALQHHQALAQAQPQAGAAKVFGGLQVGRLKAVEDVGLALQGNAATRVFDLHLQVLVEPSHMDLDLALRGELDGVVDQVAHHLAQPGAIDPHRLWHVVCKVELPCQTLVQGFLPQGCERLAEQGAQFAGARKKHHLPALQLREIQNVVDHLKQVFCGAADVPHGLQAFGVMRKLVLQ